MTIDLTSGKPIGTGTLIRPGDHKPIKPTVEWEVRP